LIISALEILIIIIDFLNFLKTEISIKLLVFFVKGKQINNMSDFLAIKSIVLNFICLFKSFLFLILL